MVRAKIHTHAITEGIIPIYKTKKIELEVSYWEIYGICDGCAKKNFLSTKTNSLRIINLKVRESGLETCYCSPCAIDALNEINKEAKKLVLNPELDNEKIEQQINQRQQQSKSGN